MTSSEVTLLATSISGVDCDCLGESFVCVLYTGGTIGMMRNEKKVLAPVPNVMLQCLRELPSCHDKQYLLDRKGSSSDINENSLVLPYMEQEYRRVIYDVVEYTPLLDSSNIRFSDWKRIARDIKSLYNRYNGFVILHGTDTLAYTASALSFTLENLGKPVIVTGSQIPIFDARTDAVSHFVLSILIAGNYNVPEVCVLFNNKLLRGNRTTKTSSSSLAAFDSLNAPAIALCGVTIELNSQCIFRQKTTEAFRVHTNLEDKIVILRMFPNISPATVRALLQPPTLGVVLQSFGSGNVPSNSKYLLEALKEAVNRGVIIINTTQCPYGSVSSGYETGNVLLEIGVLPGYDMTQEAALTKLAYVLRKDQWNLNKKKQMMQTNIRGELTATTLRLPKENDLVEAIARTFHLTKTHELKKLSSVIFTALIASAVVDGDMEKLNNLKSYGADFSSTNVDGRSALHLACHVGNIDVVNMLLSNGCSVFVRDRFNRTPLHEAIDMDNHDAIKLLKKYGALLQDNPQIVADVLCALAERGTIRRLQSFQLAGADLTTPDRTGRTTLHIAAELDDIELVEYLLPYFPDKHIKDNIGHTPLDYARASGNPQITNLFQSK